LAAAPHPQQSNKSGDQAECLMKALATRKAYMKLISFIYENHVLVTAKVAFKADCAAHCDTHTGPSWAL
jgi:hypothetical protein